MAQSRVKVARSGADRRAGRVVPSEHGTGGTESAAGAECQSLIAMRSAEQGPRQRCAELTAMRRRAELHAELRTELTCTCRESRAEPHR